MMHLDTLAGMGELKICKSYMVNGKETTFFPGDAADVTAAECVYDTLPGWDEDLSEIRTYDELPENTKNYIAAVEKIVGVPVSIVGVGPKRSQAIFRD
jgi:adenylosuccinate synthase